MLVTIKDVAKYSGVSVATVSRAVNNSGYVHEDTRKKVNEAVEALNYRPNETARSLYNRKSKIIGLLLPDISNPFFTLVARGVEDAALKKGYHVIIGNSDQCIEKEESYIETFKVNNCVGFISSTLQMKNANQYMKKLEMAHITLDRTSDEFYAIEADHTKGGRLQAEFLISKGCKNILVIHGDLAYSSFNKRFVAAVDTLTKNKIQHDTLKLSSNDVKDDLFKKLSDFDGLICYNDMIAIQLMGFIQNQGRKVPNDIQIIGYDDIQISSYTFPKLTTINQSAYNLGRVACEQLIQLILNEPVTQCIKLDVELIERNSTRSDII